MGDLAREYGRIAALAAAGAFVLSFCIGLLSRNPFVTALLRALLLALVFAGLGAGLKAVIKRWLPELEASNSRAAGPDGAESVGQAVDIVLPGEGYAASGVETGDAGLPQETSDLFGEPAGGPAGASASPGKPAGSDAAPELDEVPPLESVDEPAAGARGTGEAASSRRDSSGVGGTAPEPGLQGRERSREGLDALPDIAGLAAPGTAAESPGVSPPEATSGGTPAPARKPRTPHEAVRGALGREDPASLAKAVRTVLKRDDKG